MSEANNRKMQGYLAVVFVLVLAVLYFYVVKPIQSEATDADRELTGKNDMYAALQKKAEGINRISDEDRVKLEAVRRVVPEQPGLETIIRKLRQLEVVSGAKLKQYNLTEGTVVPDAANAGNAESNPASAGLSIPIHIDTNFTGTYAQIYRLFNEMESLDRLIQVEKMSFNLKQGPIVQINAASEEIVSNLTLVAYYSPSMQGLLGRPADIDYASPSGRANPFN